jgi:hypothetical protein
MGGRDARLEAAYRAAVYVVSAAADWPEVVIRCGANSDELDGLLTQQGVDEWAFITACNPRSELLPAAENEARMAKLRAALRDRKYRWLKGRGEDRAGDWPDEPSLLVLGIPEPDAVALAAQFNQHAILVGRRGDPARLAWTTGASG